MTMHEKDKARIIASIDGTVYEFPTVQARDRFIVTEGWKNPGAAQVPDKATFIDGLTITRQPDQAPVNQAPEKKVVKKRPTFGAILKALRGDSPRENAPAFSEIMVMKMVAQAENDKIRLRELQGEIASLQSACAEAQKINEVLRSQILAISLPIATPFTDECKLMPFTATMPMLLAGRTVLGEAIYNAIEHNEPILPDLMLALIGRIYISLVFASPDYAKQPKEENDV
jgi:hypothetical protein